VELGISFAAIRMDLMTDSGTPHGSLFSFDADAAFTGEGNVVAEQSVADLNGQIGTRDPWNPAPPTALGSDPISSALQVEDIVIFSEQ
jgi:hypothetical protein